MKPTAHFTMLSALAVWLFTFLTGSNALCQTTAIGGTEYARSSFTILHFDDEDGKKLDFRAFVKTDNPYTSRFDWNDISSYWVQMGSSPSAYKAQELTTNMNQSGIGRELIAYWFQRKKNGLFDTRLIASRGMYNASDMAKQLANSSPRDNAELQDAGFKLINQTYAILFYVNSFMTMEEYYDLEDQIAREKARDIPEYKFKPVARTHRGFAGKTTAYFFKLDYNDQVKQQFYDLWIYDSDSEEEIARKRTAFETLQVPFIYVGQFTPRYTQLASVEKNQDKVKTIDISAGFKEAGSMTDEDLMQSFAESAVEMAIDYFIKKGASEDLQVKTGIYDLHPTQAKIGVKEGVYPEKRFRVYEKREKPNGQIVYQKKGVVRAKRGVTDNRFSQGTDTRPSRFFRVNGLAKLKEGMLLKEFPEKGLAVGVLYAPSLTHGTGIRDVTVNAEWNLSLMLGKTFGSGAFNGYRVGAGYSIEMYLLPGSLEENNYQTFERQIFYLKKEWPLVSIFRLSLFSGISFYQSSNDANALESFSAIFIPIGGEFGIALSPWLNSFVQTEYDLGLYDADQIIDGQRIATGVNWYDIYPYRKGLTHRVGMRILF